MILFLDDDPNRAALAYQRMTKDQKERTIWCKTVQETITTLWDYRNELELVMLDHDLNGETYVNIKRDDCGMEVVRFLERLSRREQKEFKKFRENVKFIIHSHNTYAGPRMVERLQAIGLVTVLHPFGT